MRASLGGARSNPCWNGPSSRWQPRMRPWVSCCARHSARRARAPRAAWAGATRTHRATGAPRSARRAASMSTRWACTPPSYSSAPSMITGTTSQRCSIATATAPTPTGCAARQRWRAARRGTTSRSGRARGRQVNSAIPRPRSLCVSSTRGRRATPRTPPQAQRGRLRAPLLPTAAASSWAAGTGRRSTLTNSRSPSCGCSSRTRRSSGTGRSGARTSLASLAGPARMRASPLPTRRGSRSASLVAASACTSITRRSRTSTSRPSSRARTR